LFASSVQLTMPAMTPIPPIQISIAGAPITPAIHPPPGAKTACALPRTGAREKRTRQWRSVPSYAPPGISDYVRWSVQRRKCVIEELAIPR
jgi:hypothetical protein